jgi:L-asparaginase
MHMPRICLITTGGTIASRPTASGDVLAEDGGDTLRNSLHDSLEGIEVVVEDFCNVGSYAIDIPMAFRLSQLIASKLAGDEFDGVVVTHGTDTMEESAYMADLLVDTDKPMVFTGAQRNAGMPDTDGPRNLANAIRVAASPAARGLGAVIAFEGDFHAARDVSKTHTSRVDTFRSREHGKLGEVDGGAVYVQRRPAQRRTFSPTEVVSDIELIKLVMGSSDRFIRHAAADGAKAIVLECFGIGNATPAVTAAVSDIIAAGVPVIITSRCPEGRVRPVYGNGGGKDLERAGAIFAGDLNGPKARIALAVLLGLNLSTDDLRDTLVDLGL